MEEFTENYSSILLSKEWLVKVDNANSIPYLFKFGVSEDKATCFILITDTKTVWTEALTKNRMIRRWRECNPSSILANNDEAFSLLRTLVWDVHTPGGISDADFDSVESRDADLAFEIDCDEFKWRWDAYLLGPKTSADVISRHLIIPLISLAHVSFYSADPVSELDEGDLEKTVDRIGRTARRSVDIHVKHTMARPRVASTLQRISSLLALAPTLPSIRSEVESPDLKGQFASLRAHIDTTSNQASARALAVTSNESQEDVVKPTFILSPRQAEPKAQTKSVQQSAGADSATESDDDDVDEQDQELLAPKSREAGFHDPSPRASTPASAASRTSEVPLSRPLSRAQNPESDSPPAPPPPTKKLKKNARNSSDSDSDSASASDSDPSKKRSQGSESRAASSSTGVRNTGSGYGVRQPIKRVGRRF